MTYRTAADCSTTELYTLIDTSTLFINTKEWEILGINTITSPRPLMSRLKESMQYKEKMETL